MQKLKVIVETRLSRKAEWEPLVPGQLFTEADADEIFSTLERDDDGLFRRRLLPEYGYDTREFRWAPPGGWQADGPLVLARDMPASVHALNNDILTALGV